MKQFKKLLAPLFSILVALLLGTALIWACGYEPFRAYSALLKGAFGSVRYALATLEKSVPMILCGLAAVVAMKSGIFNIGAEGQLYIGALAYTAAALYLDFLPGVIHLAVCLAAAIAGGALWALIPAVMKVRLRINEVVTSIMLNYTAKLLIAFLVSGPMKAPGDVSQSEAIPASAAIGEIAAGGKITWGFMLAIVLCVVVWVIFRHTSFGYDITAAGMNDRAAAAGGIRPDQVRLQAMLISGGLADCWSQAPLAGWSSRYRPATASTASRLPCWACTPLSACFCPVCCSAHCGQGACIWRCSSISRANSLMSCRESSLSSSPHPRYSKC